MTKELSREDRIRMSAQSALGTEGEYTNNSLVRLWRKITTRGNKDVVDTGSGLYEISGSGSERRMTRIIGDEERSEIEKNWPEA